MMRRNATFAIIGMVLLMCAASGGAVADDVVIELQHVDAIDLVTVFGSYQHGLLEESITAAQERTAVSFAMEAMSRAAGMASVFAGNAPFVQRGARFAPGTGPALAIHGTAEVIVREPFGELPKADGTVVGGHNGAYLLPEGLTHQLTVTPGSNAIAVHGTPEAIEELREIVAILDTPVKRVHLSVSLHEVTADELEAKVPGVADALDADGPPTRFALPDTEVLTDWGGIGRVLARVECTVLNGCLATVSLAEIVPVFAGTVSLAADGTPMFENESEAYLAGICMDIQVQAGPDGHIRLGLRCLRVETEGQTNTIMPPDIEVSGPVKMMVALSHSASLVMSGPSVAERYNEQREQSRSVHSQIQEDLRAVIVITPTVILPDEGDAQ